MKRVVAPDRKVAIVVPLSNRSTFTADEEVSLRHLHHYLGRYDKFAIVPQSLAISLPGFGIERFADHFFGSAAAHARLTLDEQLYARFRRYQYILVYHLDALAFSDSLLEWCDTGLDYIGAPWLICADTPWVKEERVGNGGFCLMNVQSALKVLSSKLPDVDPDEYWRKFCSTRPRHVQLLNLPRKYLKRLNRFNGVRRLASSWHLRRNGDFFWADEAKRFYPDYKVASVEQGLAFAFEAAPRLCFERNHERMPFGCHAWQKFDPAFWEPHLLPAEPRTGEAPAAAVPVPAQ